MDIQYTLIQAVANIIKHPPAYRDYTGTDYDTCVYCQRPVERPDQQHAPDCLWVALKKAYEQYVRSTSGAGMTRKGYCPQCGTKREIETKMVKQTFPVLGELIEVESEVAFCKACGEEVFDRELDFAALEKAYDKYRKMKGMSLSEFNRRRVNQWEQGIPVE
jgi:YgiT-type zinc finger domain-containing protein